MAAAEAAGPVPSASGEGRDGASQQEQDALLKLPNVKVAKQARSTGEASKPKQPQHDVARLLDAVPFTPSQGVRTPSPGPGWLGYSPFAAQAHAQHPPSDSPNTVLRSHGTSTNNNSDASSSESNPHMAPPLHPWGSMGYPPYHMAAAMYHLGSLPPPGEPGSPHNPHASWDPPSPLMGSPVSTPTAMMFPQTPFAGAHAAQPFSPYHAHPHAHHHLASPVRGPPFKPTDHPLSPQGSAGAGYGWFHPIFNSFTAFLHQPPPPPPHGAPSRTTSSAHKAAGGEGGSSGSQGAGSSRDRQQQQQDHQQQPAHSTTSAHAAPAQHQQQQPAAPSQQQQGSQEGSPGTSGGGAAQGEGEQQHDEGEHEMTPQEAMAAAHAAMARAMSGMGISGSMAATLAAAAAQSMAHNPYGLPPGLSAAGLPNPYMGFPDPALLASMLMPQPPPPAPPASRSANAQASGRNPSTSGQATGTPSGHPSYAQRRPTPLQVGSNAAAAAAAARASMGMGMMMAPPWAAGMPGMLTPPHVMMMGGAGAGLGAEAAYWEQAAAFHAAAMSMSMGMGMGMAMPPARGQYPGMDGFEFPDLSRGAGLGMSPPGAMPNFLSLAAQSGLLHGTPPGAGVPPPPPPRSGQRGSAGTMTPSPPNPKARRALAPQGTPGSASSGGAGGTPGSGGGTPGGAPELKLGADGLPRLNARQRRTLRRAKERAIRGLMEAGHLLLQRTAAAAGGGPLAGEPASAGAGAGGDSSGSDGEDNIGGGAGADTKRAAAKAAAAAAAAAITDGEVNCATAASVEMYISAAMSVASGSHGPQAAADASAALSKVAAELEDMDIGEAGDIGDLIHQLSARKEDGLDGLVRDLTIIQNLMGALKIGPQGASRGSAATSSTGRSPRPTCTPPATTPPTLAGSISGSTGPGSSPPSKPGSGGGATPTGHHSDTLAVPSTGSPPPPAPPADAVAAAAPKAGSGGGVAVVVPVAVAGSNTDGTAVLHVTAGVHSVGVVH